MTAHEALTQAEETISKSMSWLGGYQTRDAAQEERRQGMLSECTATLKDIRAILALRDSLTEPPPQPASEYRPATLAECLYTIRARLSEHLSSAESRELLEAVHFICAQDELKEEPAWLKQEPASIVAPNGEPPLDSTVGEERK